MATKVHVLAADDELVVKNRALMQTSVNRGEPPFKALAKLFFEYSRNIEQGNTQKAAEQLPLLLHEISQLEGASRKMRSVCNTNDREQRIYNDKLSECQLAIEQAKRDIEARKQELKEAQLVRQHKMEYEVVRQMIMDHPPRSDTQKGIQQVLEDIKAIESSASAYQQLLDLKRKQFALLLHAIDDLQGLADTPMEDDMASDAMQE